MTGTWTVMPSGQSRSQAQRAQCQRLDRNQKSGIRAKGQSQVIWREARQRQDWNQDRSKAGNKQARELMQPLNCCGV